MNKKILLVLVSGSLVLFLSLGALLARTGSRDDAYGYLAIFGNIVHLVEANYVEQVDFNSVMDSAVSSMVESLDPDSFFLKAGELSEYKKIVSQDQNAADPGLAVVKRMGMVMVLAVERGSSAEQNKLQPGDSIRTIDGEYVQELPIYKINHLLKGPAGSTVTITLFESALEKPKELTLKRAAITHPYTRSFVVQPRIGYIGVRHLLPGVDQEIEDRLFVFKEQEVDRLILDLRGCTESDLDNAVKVAGLFIGSAPVVQISGRTGSVEKVNGSGKASFQGTLLVVADSTTAGAAEILAGAIQDSGAGKVFGTRTFGRGGIQKLIPAGDNWLVLTTEKYLTPKGKMILNNGIEPAVAYKLEEKNDKTDQNQDLLLDKAIEYLKYPEKKAA